VCPIEFHDEILQEKLRVQFEAVSVFDENGQERKNINARYAADLALTGEYVGVGNRHRIRFIKPAGMRRRRPVFVTTVEIKQLLAEYPKKPEVERNYQPRGNKGWVQQPAQARTGQGGPVHTIHFRK
jgi:hypothetical protein